MTVADTDMDTEPERQVQSALAVRSLSKRYGPTRALNEIDLDLAPGELRALIGGNGSGKSTLIKILAGVERPDRGGSMQLPAGTIYLNGVTPQQSRAEGLRFVHQDLALIDDLSVAENLALGEGFVTGRLGLVRWRDVDARARGAIDRFGINVRPQDAVGMLPALIKTQIAVARALGDVDDTKPGVLVFDEPTTSMTNRESADFLGWLRAFAGQGQAVIFVSHRLDEVLSFAETVTVLRDGSQVGTVDRAQLDERSLVRMMTGKALHAPARPAVRERSSRPRLDIRGLCVGPLRDVELHIEPGEVVGVAGLLGSGRTTLLRALMGDLQPDAGEMRLDGEPHAPPTVAAAMRAGLAYVPEDRAGEGIFPDLSVAENLMAGAGSAHSRKGWVAVGQEGKAVEGLIRDFRIRCGGPRHELSTLSGGNQQKVVIARWLYRRPRLLLLDEPSQGVDVLARRDIDDSIRRAAEGGMSVLVVTSDFHELAQVSDRLIILRRGRVVDQLSREQLNEALITERTYGSVGA